MNDTVTLVHWAARKQRAAPHYDLALVDIDAWEAVNQTVLGGKPITAEEAGTAHSPGYAKRLLSWWPGGQHSMIPNDYVSLLEPPAAMFTSYSPPSPFVLTPDECAEVIALADRKPPSASVNKVPSLELKDVGIPSWAHDRILSPVMTANDAWWRLDIDEVRLVLLRYDPGIGFEEHQDMHPGHWHRKLAATFQLSDPTTYQGGDLVLRGWAHQWTASRARGSVTVFPGWCPHEVTEVTEGVRWSLVAWGYGPPVR